MESTDRMPGCAARIWKDVSPWLPPWRPLFLGPFRCLVMVANFTLLLASITYYGKALPAYNGPWLRHLLIANMMIQSVALLVTTMPVMIDCIFDKCIQRRTVRAVYCLTAVAASVAMVIITAMTEGEYANGGPFTRDSLLRRAHGFSMVASVPLALHLVLTFAVVIYVSGKGTLRTHGARGTEVSGGEELLPMHSRSGSPNGQTGSSGTAYRARNRENQQGELQQRERQKRQREQRERQQRAMDQIVPASLNPAKPKPAAPAKPKSDAPERPQPAAPEPQPAASSPVECVVEGPGPNLQPEQHSLDNYRPRWPRAPGVSGIPRATTQRSQLRPKLSDPAPALERQQPSDTVNTSSRNASISRSATLVEPNSPDVSDPDKGKFSSSYPAEVKVSSESKGKPLDRGPPERKDSSQWTLFQDYSGPTKEDLFNLGKEVSRRYLQELAEQQQLWKQKGARSQSEVEQ